MFYCSLLADYPESRGEAPLVRVRGARALDGRATRGDRGDDSRESRRSPALLGLREAATGVRSTDAAPLRVRAAVGLARVLRVRDAARGLPALRRDRGVGAVGDGKSPMTHRAISHTWQAPRAGLHPQILLTRPNIHRRRVRKHPKMTYVSIRSKSEQIVSSREVPVSCLATNSSSS
jgi:hypothetical protein